MWLFNFLDLKIWNNYILHNLPWYEITIIGNDNIETINYKSIYEMQRPINESSLIGLLNLGYYTLNG